MFKLRTRFGMRDAVRCIAAGSISALCLLLPATAFCDPPTAMAPPVAAQSDQVGAADSDSVFQWTEVPENQQVPLTRAVFDQNGYQLYDTVGETIQVPFANNNLYVMKFALSPTGDMYFVNTGDYPVLYVPQNGYLENASVPGARWYPFSDTFHPAQPVFLGVAPSWSAFIGMGWYPNMVFYGGYYSHSAFVAGGVFLPTVGLSIVIGGTPYHSWAGYHNYYIGHPGPTFAHGAPFTPAHEFRGALGGGHWGPGAADHSFGGPSVGRPSAGGPSGHFGPSASHMFRGTRDMVRGHNDHGHDSH